MKDRSSKVKGRRGSKVKAQGVMGKGKRTEDGWRMREGRVKAGKCQLQRVASEE